MVSGDYVDRIVFEWDELKDFVPVASSLTIEERKSWADLLHGHVVVTHDRQPETSMRYWNDGVRAAVLWRISGGGTGRSSCCRALVGAPTVLDTITALVLSEWSGWYSEGWDTNAGRLHGITGMWEECRMLAPGHLRKSDLAQLTALVRGFLELPRSALSVVTDEVAEKDKVFLLWDLREILCALFEMHEPFTFSTFETRHDDGVSSLPRMMFLPTDHENSKTYPVKRNVLYLPPRKELAADVRALHRAADRLVNEYHRLGGGKGLEDWLGHLGVLGAKDPYERVRRLLDKLAISHPPPPPPPPSPPAPRTDLELVELLCTGPDGEVDTVLTEIRQRRVASPAERPTVRRVVLENSRWVRRLCKYDDPFAVSAAVGTVVDFAVDRGEWQDHRVIGDVGRAMGAWVVPPVLEAVLAERAVRHRIWEHPELAAGLATRYLWQRGYAVRYPENAPPVPGAEAKSVSPQRVSKPRPPAHRERRALRRLLVAVRQSPPAVLIAVLALVLIVLIIVITLAQ